jgi:hypothetical protein
MSRRIRTLIFCALSLCPLLSKGQVTINAMVADSATLKPISFVTVRLLNSFKGTITNEQGYFAMEASDRDTFLLSIVGYYSKKVPVTTVVKSSVIYLTQAVQMLKPVEIRGVIEISGLLPKWDEPSKVRNPTLDRRELDVLGFQGIQTFGPGYVSGFGDLKPSKEEKKLERVKKENQKAKGYIVLVNDPQVKDTLMRKYSLNEQQYYTHLANFNQKNKQSIYGLDDTDLVALIFLYFKEKLE